MTDADALIAEAERIIAFARERREREHHDHDDVILHKALAVAYSRAERIHRRQTEHVEIKTYSC